MQILDLKKTSKIRATSFINKEYGGRYGFKEAVQLGGIGIGKLYYQSGIDAIDAVKDPKKKLRSNIEIYRKGMGIYIYNVEFNFLLLFDADELNKISIYKPADLIRVNGFSFFDKMINSNIDYYKCKIMLLEHEQVELHSASFDISITSDIVIHNKIYRYHPYKHIDFAENNLLGIPAHVDVNTYQIVP